MKTKFAFKNRDEIKKLSHQCELFQKQRKLKKQ